MSRIVKEFLRKRLAKELYEEKKVLQTGPTGTAGIRGIPKGPSLICMDKSFHTAPEELFRVSSALVAKQLQDELHEEKRFARGE